MELILLSKPKIKMKILIICLFLIFISSCDNGVENKPEVPKDYTEYGSLITDGLLAYYPFDGNAEDYSGNELHGIENGVEASAGRFDQEEGALKFDGIDDFIEIPQFSEINNMNGTICFWARIPSGIDIETESAVVSRRDTVGEGFTMSINGSTDYWFEFKVKNLRGSETMWTDYRGMEEYLFIAVTFINTSNSLVLKYYFQGHPTADSKLTSDSQFSLNNSNQPLFIGKSLIPKYKYFMGEMDDLLIYDRALTDEEILELFNWE
jgi:hypothetical protein